MNSDDLLALTRKELGIPTQVADPLRQSTDASTAMLSAPEWRRLHRAVSELEEGAQAVGEIPKGYPMPVDWVMRLIHALLPWYTRPLRKHAEHAVDCSRATRDLLAVVIARQQQLESRLQELEKQQGGGSASTPTSTPGAPGA